MLKVFIKLAETMHQSYHQVDTESQNGAEKLLKQWVLLLYLVTETTRHLKQLFTAQL